MPVDEGFRPGEILAALAGHGVNYVLVGALALAAHGVIRATRDVDLIPDPAPANLRALREALVDLAAEAHGSPQTAVDEALLGREANMRLDTRVGRVDLLLAAQYRALYPELRARALALTVDDVPVVVVSRNDLIRLKAGSGRDRDLLDIGDLLALDE